MAVRETRQERRTRERDERKGRVEHASPKPLPEPCKKGVAPLLLSCLVGMIAALVGMKLFLPAPPKKEIVEKKTKATVHVPQFSLRDKTYGNVLELTAEEVPAADIAELNLLCGSGLNGTKEIDIDECLERLDQLTEMVRAETKRNCGRLQRDPEE